MLHRRGLRLRALALLFVLCPIARGQNPVVNGDFSSPIHNGQSFQVSILNGVTLATIFSQTFATPQGVLTKVGFNFTATNSQIRVVIQDISGADTNSGWVDNVSITLVPEAGTWGALGGALALGLVGLRWRAQRAAANGSSRTT